MEYLASLLSLIIFSIGILKFWNTDDFELLSLNNSEKIYKFIYDFIKNVFIYFIYLVLLGQYYHMFSFLINDYARIYFLSLFILFILMYVIIIFSWLFTKNKKNILDDYHREISIINIFKKLSFIYFIVMIWIEVAQNYGLKDLSYFYSLENIRNVLMFSIIISLFTNIISMVISNFEDIIKYKKVYYISNYIDYSIVKNNEGNCMKLKNNINSSIIYVKYEDIYKENILGKEVAKINNKSFLLIIIKVLIVFVFIIILIVYFMIFLFYKLGFLFIEIIKRITNEFQKKKSDIDKNYTPEENLFLHFLNLNIKILDILQKAVRMNYNLNGKIITYLREYYEETNRKIDIFDVGTKNIT